MGRPSSRSKLNLILDDLQFLTKLANSKTKPIREVNRAKVILAYSNNKSITQISKETTISRETIYETT